MRPSLISILICCSLSAPTVWAADKMQPGLWEVTMKSDMYKNMPAMPKLTAEQQAQMRKMGVNMPQMQGGAIISKMCITKEMSEREEAPMGPNESGCQMKNFQRSGKSYSGDIVCDNPDIKGAGKIKGESISATSFTSSYDFKGVSHGQPVNTSHTSTSKWLALDCGAVKPNPVKK